MQINLQLIIFYVFATIAVSAGIMVIMSRNPVRAVLSLVLAFVSSAFIWMLAEAEFLALSLILVYVGAVMVLFLFVVMMLDVQISQLKEGFVRYLPIGFASAILVIGMLVWVVGGTGFSSKYFPAPPSKSQFYSNVKELGMQLFANYVYPFEIAGAILIVAIVAAISLTYRGPKRRKVQNPGLQVQVKKADRLKLVDIR